MKSDDNDLGNAAEELNAALSRAEQIFAQTFGDEVRAALKGEWGTFGYRRCAFYFTSMAVTGSRACSLFSAPLAVRIAAATRLSQLWDELWCEAAHDGRTAAARCAAEAAHAFCDERLKPKE